MAKNRTASATGGKHHLWSRGTYVTYAPDAALLRGCAVLLGEGRCFALWRLLGGLRAWCSRGCAVGYARQGVTSGHHHSRAGVERLGPGVVLRWPRGREFRAVRRGVIQATLDRDSAGPACGRICRS